MATGTSDDSNTTVTEGVLSEGVIDAIAVRVAAQFGERSGTSGLTNTQGELLGCVRGGGISKLQLQTAEMADAFVFDEDLACQLESKISRMQKVFYCYRE